MMKVEDYSGCYDSGIEQINLNKLAPIWPFRLLVIGPSGCGKTNMLVNLLFKYVYYDQIYIFAKDLEEDLYMFLKSFFDKTELMKVCDAQDIVAEACAMGSCMCEKLVHAEFHDELDLPNLDEIDKTKQTLIIFDDFITEKDQSQIEDLFIRGRKKNVSTIYLSQSYFDIPKIIRINSQYFALFNIPSRKELRSIADDHATRVDFKEFQKLYKEIAKDPYSFMIIDTRTTQMPLHIRKGWDGLLSNKGG